MANEDEPAADLCAFVDAGPSPFHAVGEMARRLDTAGFARLDERERWDLQPGQTGYVIRDGATIGAFRMGTRPPSRAGCRIIAAHTDSPTFRVRPHADLRRAGYHLVGVEVYGSPLLHTWMDRDLTVAGRVVVREDGLRTVLVHLPGAPLRLASLAIHLLQGDERSEGLKLDPQQHLAPIWNARAGDDGFLAVVAAAAGVEPAAVVGHDLVLAGTEPARLGGDDDAFVFAPRLDNLASCHAAVTALTGTGQTEATQIVVCHDHEEVGSGSAEGARGSFLEDLIHRVLAASGDDDPQASMTARARSYLVSADMAHAVHPNYTDRHEDSHLPRLGGGPVVKTSASQSYASDAASAGWFTARAVDAGVSVQQFVNRGTIRGGSTIGPLSAARLGIATVDVGNPLLSMHSAREQAATADVAPMIRVLEAHLSDGEDGDG